MSVSGTCQQNNAGLEMTCLMIIMWNELFIKLRNEPVLCYGRYIFYSAEAAIAFSCFYRAHKITAVSADTFYCSFDYLRGK